MMKILHEDVDSKHSFPMPLFDSYPSNWYNHLNSILVFSEMLYTRNVDWLNECINKLINIRPRLYPFVGWTLWMYHSLHIPLRFLTSIGRRNRSYVNFLTLSIISFLTCCNQTFLTTDRSTDAFSVYFVTYLYPYTSLRQQYQKWKKQILPAVGTVPKSNRKNSRKRGKIVPPTRNYMSTH